ncbi:hypothetical protein JX265_002862 [Neoarthrinium moseri]|uniref:Uncharacterized protein n=1 Tax=Neoarthrinium moseri TaxID=1658444 RepID=A0A9P9WT70_9PEZI|nr:uncharacterized protein JN550_008056 [Neoarthrinium moseri]KAI1851091.1 hypothetical protein JX266_003756 [Neoarthrinium moseri]KAI1865798.1 hypothetical protein JN550_008056 [Neoarthrinium moseri]KAI1878685.1 hypothetical protein JX265_002862 [Neoarthrinium moseri]
MAQGTVKPRAKPVKAPTANSAGKTKKGARVAKPKKASSADRIQKKFSSGLAARTERLLGERAGHLEMIGKGRNKSGKKDPGADAAKKGGSRKFG